MKKLKNAFVTLDLGSGQGNESQLVYTSTIHQTDVLKMWSPRWLQDHSLVTDAILGFNYPCSTDHRDVAACKTVNSVGR